MTAPQDKHITIKVLRDLIDQVDNFLYKKIRNHKYYRANYHNLVNKEIPNKYQKPIYNHKS